jgi:Na+-transporting NADH:ubiquinone oxidoreductase subunit NqrC
MNSKVFWSIMFVLCGVCIGFAGGHAYIIPALEETQKQNQALDKKLNILKLENIKDQTKCETITVMVNILRGNYGGVGPEHLGIGAAILQIQSFESKADAEREEVKLREYIEECSKIGPAAWVVL